MRSYPGSMDDAAIRYAKGVLRSKPWVETRCVSTQGRRTTPPSGTPKAFFGQSEPRVETRCVSTRGRMTTPYSTLKGLGPETIEIPLRRDYVDKGVVCITDQNHVHWQTSNNAIALANQIEHGWRCSRGCCGPILLRIPPLSPSGRKI